MYKLREIEKRLLHVLDKESSMPLNKIAKILSTSPQRVNYLIEKLKSNVIKDFITIIDYRKFGYSVGFVYYELKSMPSEKYDEIISHASKNEDILVVLEGIGIYDLALGFFFEDIFGLDKRIKSFQSKFHEYIHSDVKTIHIGAYRSGRDYLVDSPIELKKEKVITGGKVTQIDHKPIDEKILSILSRNSRSSIVEISKVLNSNPYTISSRIKYLKEKRVIKSSTIVLDLNNYDYNYYRILIRLRTIDEKKEEKIFNYLVCHPNVVQAVKTFGEYSLTIDVEVKDLFKLREFMSKFIDIFGVVVDKYKIMRVYNIPKFCYFPNRLRD